MDSAGIRRLSRTTSSLSMSDLTDNEYIFSSDYEYSDEVYCPRAFALSRVLIVPKQDQQLIKRPQEYTYENEEAKLIHSESLELLEQGLQEWRKLMLNPTSNAINCDDDDKPELRLRSAQSSSSSCSSSVEIPPKLSSDVESLDDSSQINSKGVFRKKRFESLSLESGIVHCTEEPTRVRKYASSCGVPTQPPEATSERKNKKIRTEDPFYNDTTTSSKTAKTLKTVTVNSSAQDNNNTTKHHRHASLAAIRVQLPTVESNNTSQQKSERRNKKDKSNPYQGSTPRTPVDIVHPNEKGVYNFTPSAAAFKWNWSLLDVRKRPIGGMTPQATPTNAFKMFRQDFAVSPLHRKNSISHNFLQPQLRRKNNSSSQKQPTEIVPDGLPDFPSDRRVARAVRKRNLVYTPGGAAQGKAVETAYQPIYETLVSKGGEEPSRYQLQANQIIKHSEAGYPTNNGGPIMRTRGGFSRSTSSMSMTNLIEVESQEEEDGRYMTHYIPQNTKRVDGPFLGSKMDTYHIWINAINGLLFTSTAIICSSPPKPDTFNKAHRSLQQIVSKPAEYAIKGWAVIVILAFIAESCRASILLYKAKGVKRESDTSKGRFIPSLRKAIVSSSTALALLSLLSFGISAMACLGFTLTNNNGKPGFIQNESRSFLWTVGLIHTGVSSGLLTKKLFAKSIPMTTPAFNVMGRSRLTVIMGCLLPSIAGWLLVRLSVQYLNPSWHAEYFKSEGSNTFDFIANGMAMLMSFLEYFEAIGYWKAFLWFTISSTCSLLLLDFVDLTISLTNEYYHHGGIWRDTNPDFGKLDFQLFVKLLLQGIVATGLSAGSFWQWPLNLTSLAKWRLDLVNQQSTYIEEEQERLVK